MCSIQFFYPITDTPSLDIQTLKILDECAEKNTQFLKGKITQESINKFEKYYNKIFSLTRRLPLVLFSYTQTHKTDAQGSWSLQPMDAYKYPNHMTKRADNFLVWLKKNYTPHKNLKFFYLLEEPYANGWCVGQFTQHTLSELMSSCPTLISCNHPNLKWTKSCVLIPDDYILADAFDKQIDQLLNSPVYTSISDLDVSEKKGVAIFSQRKSKLFFSGILTGPKRPFCMETLTENPRHLLLTLLHQYPYVDFRISSFLEWAHPPNSSYLDYLVKNFSHLKLGRVDFFEHAKHKYLLSCDGFGAAWTRPELIMATGSVLFQNAKCEQYFYHLMENNTTHVSINTDFSNLDAEFNRLESNPDVAQKIGEQGRSFARQFFTKPAIDTYLTAALRKIESYSP